MLEDGKRPCDIMKKLKRSKRFIFESRNNRKTIYKCQTKKHSGASKKLNVKSKKIIRESRCKKKGLTRKLAKKVKQSGTTSVSHQTIWRFQRKERMKPYKRRQEPLYSTKNIQSRTQFA